MLGSCERDSPSGSAAGAARVSLVTRLPYISRSCSHIYRIIRRDVIVFSNPVSVVSFRGVQPAVWLRIPEEDHVVIVVIVVVVVIIIVAIIVTAVIILDVVLVLRGSLPYQLYSAYFLPPRRRRRLVLLLIVVRHYSVTISFATVLHQKTLRQRAILDLANTCDHPSLFIRTHNPITLCKRLISRSILSPVVSSAVYIAVLLFLVLDPV
jgi:hypothetical protein